MPPSCSQWKSSRNRRPGRSTTTSSTDSRQRPSRLCPFAARCQGQVHGVRLPPASPPGGEARSASGGTYFFIMSKNSALVLVARILRSEEHTSELQSLMRISYAVFCLKKKTKEIAQLIK